MFNKNIFKNYILNQMKGNYNIDENYIYKNEKF